MIYQSVSIQEVIGRVIRNTGTRDTTFIENMDIWIAEAVGRLKTKFVLSNQHQDLDVHFHRATLPCNLSYLKAVEYRGQRLEPNSRGIHSRATPQSQELFRSVPFLVETPTGNYRTDSTAIPFCSDSLESCMGLVCSEHWYECELNFLTTSFAEGCIRIYYKGMACDQEGYPLVPDNEFYLQAVYWYVRAMMIGAGYPDKVFSHQYCMQEYHINEARAKAEIRYPTVDSMDDKIPELAFSGLSGRYLVDGLIRDQDNRLYF